MNKDADLLKFNRLLKLRTILKGVAQISWNISQLEKRYPVESLTNDEVDALLTAYGEFAEKIRQLADELKEDED